MNRRLSLGLGECIYNLTSKEVSGPDGQSRPLRAQSAQVLDVLAERSNEIVTKDELFEAVWPGVSVTDDSVTQCIADIRKAIGDTDRTILRTIPKKGFQLLATHTAPSPNNAPVRAHVSGASWRATIGVFAIIVFASAVFGLSRMQWSTGEAVQPIDSKASITVLPFADLSPDQDLEHFADGMTEDLITDLARWKEFRVTARNSAMTYKDRAVDIRAVAREMNTRYVLEGSMRRVGDEMRITAQLVDGQTGTHVWADRFEEASDDILALQDEVITRVVQTLIGNYGVLREAEYARTWAKAETSLEEYDYYLRGHSSFYLFTPESVRTSIETWTAGLAKYPDSGLLKIKLGWGHYFAGLMGDSANARPNEELLASALAAFADPRLPPAGHRHGLWLLSELHSELGHRKETIATVEETMRSYPFDPEGLMYAADDLVAVGEYERARQLHQRVEDLNYSLSPNMLAEAGVLDYAEGDCGAAVPKFEGFTVDLITMLLLAGCYADDGRAQDSKDVLEKAEKVFGVRSPEGFPPRFANMPGVTERLTAQLARVDWP